MPKAPRQLLVLLVAAALAGCAAQSAEQASDDGIQILPIREDDANFLVLFLNRQTLLYNGDLPADRVHIIASRLKSVGCSAPRLVREKAEPQSGTWSFGRQRIVYYSEWKCV
jgi:hypothetical protein